MVETPVGKLYVITGCTVLMLGVAIGKGVLLVHIVEPSVLITLVQQV